jgi:predicted DNA-binding protein YlxM (UPF0122 family)
MTDELTYEKLNETAKEFFGIEWRLLTQYQRAVISYYYYDKKGLKFVEIGRALNMTGEIVSVWISKVRKEIDICREKKFRRANEWIK